MRRSLAAALLVAAMVSLLPGLVAAQRSAKVLMFVQDGSRDLHLMLTEEVFVMRAMLEEAGFAVDVATANGEPMAAGDARLVPDLKVDDADASSYAGFILPCMAPAAGTPVPPAILALLESAVASGKPIAASRAAVETVAEAGVLAGRNYSFASPVDVAQRPAFAGGRYQGTGITRDGNLSTAGICPLSARSTGQPDGTVDLTRAFIASLRGTN